MCAATACAHCAHPSPPYAIARLESTATHDTARLLSAPCDVRPQYVGRLVTNYEANWKKEGIELVKGLASFDDAQTVRVKLNAGGEQIIKASKVLVAVGGRPASPEDVPGIDLAINRFGLGFGLGLGLGLGLG